MTNTTGIRGKFVERFGEDDAKAIEAAAEQHSNGSNSERKGSDAFRWALLIAIGWECISRFRGDHGIKLDTEELREWCKDHADFGSHNGDCDYLSLMSGEYENWMRRPIPTSEVA